MSIFQYAVVFGGKDKFGELAPAEIMKHDEDNLEWVKIEMSDQASSLPFVGMMSLGFMEKFYIVGGWNPPSQP